MPLFLFVACVASAPEDVDSEAPDAPGYAVQPVWSADEAFTALNFAFSLGIPEPFSLGRVYEGAMGHADFGDGACPNYEDPANRTAWGTWYTAGCTSTDGWSFYGTAEAYMGTRAVDGGTETSVGGLASWEITDTEGALFVGGGSFGVDVVTADAGGTSWEGLFGGTWHYPASEVPWLADGVHTALFYGGQADGEQLEMIVDGGIEHLGTDLYFEDAHFLRGACGGWPQGELRVRDPAAAWFTFTLDDRCDGCGRLGLPGGGEEERCLDSALSGIGEDLFAHFEGL